MSQCESTCVRDRRRKHPRTPHALDRRRFGDGCCRRSKCVHAPSQAIAQSRQDGANLTGMLVAQVPRVRHIVGKGGLQERMPTSPFLRLHNDMGFVVDELDQFTSHKRSASTHAHTYCWVSPSPPCSGHIAKEHSTLQVVPHAYTRAAMITIKHLELLQPRTRCARNGCGHVLFFNLFVVGCRCSRALGSPRLASKKEAVSNFDWQGGA